MAENYLQNRGEGEWIIAIYNPADQMIGPIKGVLVIGKDFHVIQTSGEGGVCLASIPSQNVAYCLNSGAQN